MTENKHVKARIRARMARTGERYMTARRHVVGTQEAAEDHGWQLSGGVHPDTAALAAVLAHDGVAVSEATVLGIGGGLGAGYILWEFSAHRAPTLVLGFRNAWHYPDRWMRKTLDRLGLKYAMHETSGVKRAASTLDEAIASGRPAIVTVDRAEIGVWHRPAWESGRMGGHPVVVHAIDGDRVLLDDRNLAALSVSRERLDAARARVPSYKHRLVVTDPAVVSVEALGTAVRDGLADAIEHLSSPSDSFGLGAWRKWARMLVDSRNPKAWSNVFAGQRGLVGALLAAYEAIEPVGTDGGNLRALYADFLTEAAALLETPDLLDAAAAYRTLGGQWHSLAELLLPQELPAFASMRAELSTVHERVVANGDAGATDAASAAERLWALQRELDDALPLELDLTAISDAVAEIYDAEIAAAETLARAAVV